jgi:ElaB/YqjD/DUF883 family membrane-anchored ribosome-binding protein
MTTDQMMKKIGLRKENLKDGKAGAKIKNQVSKYLKETKGRLLMLENQITSRKDFKKLQDKVIRAKKNLKEARQTFDKYEKKASEYIEKNPKKAIAMAVAAGVLAGTIWSTFNGKKPVQKKKNKS